MISERVIYGIQAVRQALRDQLSQVVRVYVQQDLGRQRYARLDTELRQLQLSVETCGADELQRLTGTGKHQGIVAIVAQSSAMDERAARKFVENLQQPLLLILDGVQDPRNFGSCLRTAEAAGVDLVVTARKRSVDVTPVVSKVASGAAELQPQARVANLARFMEFLQQQGVWIVGTDEGADVTLFDIDVSGALALVMGGEGRGLRRLTRERCDRLVRLPMHGAVESLNLSVAAGVCLYECLRQRSGG